MRGVLLASLCLCAAAGQELSAAAVRQPLASVNIVDALWSVDMVHADASSTLRAATEACTTRGFTTVRWGATLFWPNDMALWRANATGYWAGVDAAVHALEAGGCTRLVPSFFWNAYLFPDMVGEPLGSLAVGARGWPTSLAWNLTNVYLVEFLGRYAHRPSMYMWELGNEFNLLVDIDQSAGCYACNPPGGTPPHRTRADNISTADWMAISTGWAATIRAADASGRRIGSGHAVARPSAEHLRASYTTPNATDWREDTFAQFTQNLGDTHVACDAASVHLYSGPDLVRWGNLTSETSGDILLWVEAAAASVGAARGRPLTVYVGEFGQEAVVPAGGGPPDPNATRPFVDDILRVLAVSGPGVPPADVPPPGVPGVVDFATAWVWEYPGQNGTWALWPGVTDGVISALVEYNGALAT